MSSDYYSTIILIINNYYVIILTRTLGVYIFGKYSVCCSGLADLLQYV